MTAYPPAPPPGQPGPPGADGAPPVCPRHPDRVSYVRCQRCGRPACPECQRPAAVGVHCVDCVREEARSTRPRTTVLGARVSADNRPIVTMTFIGICVVLFLADYVSPTLRMQLEFAPNLGAAQPYRMLTTAFLHAGIVHLLFNMYALWIVGPFLERMLGRWRYIALYLLSAFGGSVAVLATVSEGARNIPTVGASGAVFGLFAAIAVVLRRTGRDARQILIVIAINIAIGFVISGISWQAHLGGLFTGAALGALFAYLPKKYRTSGAIAGVIAVAAILIGITVALYS